MFQPFNVNKIIMRTNITIKIYPYAKNKDIILLKRI